MDGVQRHPHRFGQPAGGVPGGDRRAVRQRRDLGEIEGAIWWAALPSTAYTFSAWVYTTSPNVQIGFNWENAAGTYIGNSLTGSIAVPASTWTLVTTTQTSNAAAAKGIARAGATGLSETIWATDIFAVAAQRRPCRRNLRVPRPHGCHQLTWRDRHHDRGAGGGGRLPGAHGARSEDAAVTMTVALAVTTCRSRHQRCSPPTPARSPPPSPPQPASRRPAVVVNAALAGVYLSGSTGTSGGGAGFRGGQRPVGVLDGARRCPSRPLLPGGVRIRRAGRHDRDDRGWHEDLPDPPPRVQPHLEKDADLAAMTTLLSTLKADGAVVDVALWHQPCSPALARRTRSPMWNYYAPTVLSYYPTVFVPNVASLAIHGEDAYYPGDTYVSKVCVDIYDSQYKTGQDLAKKRRRSRIMPVRRSRSGSGSSTAAPTRPPARARPTSPPFSATSRRT